MRSAPPQPVVSTQPAPPVTGAPGWRRSLRSRLRRLGVSASKHLVLIVLSCVFGLPLIWMIGTSFKTAGQALQLPVVWWPHPFLWSNYPQLFASLPMWRFFLNTFVYAAVTIVGVCLSSSLVAYGFSRLRWPGRNAVFYLMLMILPFVCTLIPLFVMSRRFGWIGTYLPLEVPTFFGSSACPFSWCTR